MKLYIKVGNTLIKRNKMKTTILQIRNENTKEGINIEIKVADIERFKKFMKKQELMFTFEEVDVD